MLSKNDKTVLSGVITVVAVTSSLNLLLKFDFTLSVLFGLISGVIVGMIIDKLQGE